MKAVLFAIFVIVSLWLYCLLVKDQNFESYPIPDGTGQYYNPL